MVARLDFHIHTIPNSDKDSNFNFSKQWLIEYVSKAHLDAIAVTNHNLFDKDQYYEIVNCLGDDCIIYPGVELNVGDGHANIVFDNTVGNVNSLAEILNNLDLGINGSISIQEFESYFKDMDSGLIILEQGKSNSINFSEEFKDVFFSNYIFVYGVSNQFRFLRILNSDNKIVPVLFSDCHATNDKNDTRNEIKKLVEKNTFVQIDPQDLRFKDICQQLKDKTHVSINEKDLPNTFTVVPCQ